jgi:superfamily II DNA or RNA helicase
MGKNMLRRQWEERLRQILPNLRIGLIQGTTMDIDEKDVVLVMLQTIMPRKRKADETADEDDSDDDTADDDTDDRVVALLMHLEETKRIDEFGLLVVDECHHIAARRIAETMPYLQVSNVLGLSATPKRDDGMEYVVTAYLGPIIYDAVQQRNDKKVVVNKVFIRDTAFPLTPNTITVSTLANDLADSTARNLLIVKLVQYLAKTRGKQPLVLSVLREHLAMFDRRLSAQGMTVGQYVGGSSDEALRVAQTRDAVLGTYSMSSEGMDIPSLESLIFALPMKKIIQSVGRIVRKNQLPGISHRDLPLALDLVDETHAIFINQSHKRTAEYKQLGYIVQRYPTLYFDIKDDTTGQLPILIAERKRIRKDIKEGAAALDSLSRQLRAELTRRKKSGTAGTSDDVTGVEEGVQEMKRGIEEAKERVAALQRELEVVQDKLWGVSEACWSERIDAFIAAMPQ